MSRSELLVRQLLLFEHVEQIIRNRQVAGGVHLGAADHDVLDTEHAPVAKQHFSRTGRQAQHVFGRRRRELTAACQVERDDSRRVLHTGDVRPDPEWHHCNLLRVVISTIDFDRNLGSERQ
jgi:hypothetical protein